ncbi:hypothetical protein PNQ27_10560 [Halobacterium salinarum]|nr:hypothetical protein [Halobacterium salinarum]
MVGLIVVSCTYEKPYPTRNVPSWNRMNFDARRNGRPVVDRLYGIGHRIRRSNVVLVAGDAKDVRKNRRCSRRGQNWGVISVRGGELCIMVEVRVSETDRSERVVRSKESINIDPVSGINKNTHRLAAAPIKPQEERLVAATGVGVLKGNLHFNGMCWSTNNCLPFL